MQDFGLLDCNEAEQGGNQKAQKVSKVKSD